MKHFLAFLFLSILGLPALSALDASLSYASFRSPETSYIEIYLHVAGKTVAQTPVTDSTFRAAVDVIILFKQKDEIVKFDKYHLNGPVSKRPSDFIDMKRYGLPDGAYELVVAVEDANRADNKREYRTQVEIAFDDQSVQQSDLQLLAAFAKSDGPGLFVKNGVMMEPLPFNFYGKNAGTLSFYNEVYNTDKFLGEDFMVSYSIQLLNDEESNPVMIGHKRMKPAPTVPLLLQMDISELESGNYNLVVEVRNRERELISRKTLFFQRSNPYLRRERLELAEVDLSQEFVHKLSSEQLEYSLRALTAKLPPGDVELVNTMIKRDSVSAMRLYLFSYWAQESPTNPEFAYQKYMEVADAIDQQFQSGFRYGFETDRGYIYLKYGQPDDMELRDTEPSAPPYEIWTYYEFPRTNQNNVKFVFYNPSLAPGDFQLLHSTAIGEINNPQWQLMLYSDAPNEVNGNPIDGTEMMDNFNRNARRVFRDY